MSESELFHAVLRKLDRLLDRHLDGEPEVIDLASVRALVWNGAGIALKPVRMPVRILPDDLLGIDSAKRELFRNTRNFLSGRNANNVLLWGERGTGKSSLVKSLMTAFADEPLRIIQVLPHDILTIRDMYGFIRGFSSFRFILFIDDLSFTENETAHKELKTIMDGGLEEIPDNVLFYATSNRKHLVPTRFSDREGDEIRPADAMEEKISLVDRFGLRLAFGHFSQDTYLAIVDLYARKYGVDVDENILRERAVRWSLEAGGRNGRTAEQFARHIRQGSTAP